MIRHPTITAQIAFLIFRTTPKASLCLPSETSSDIWGMMAVEIGFVSSEKTCSACLNTL